MLPFSESPQGRFSKLREYTKERENVASRKQKIKNKKELKKFLGGQLCSITGTECVRTDRSKKMKGSMREIF